MSTAEAPSRIVDFDLLAKQLGYVQPFGDVEGFWQGKGFQLCARGQLIRKKRNILSMDKGLGKTSTILSIFEDPLVHKDVPGFTVIIFTSKKGMKVYIRDLDKLFGGAADKVQIVYGTKEERKKAWRNNKAKYFIVTYNTFLSDCGVRSSKHAAGKESIVPGWVFANGADGVVCDEFHRVFRNRTSKTFELFKKLFRFTEYFFPISGSAVDKGPQDLWPALHLCDQKFWSSYWNYVGTWCNMEINWTGHKQITGPKNLENWRKLMKHWVFHVTRDMIAGAPKKERQFLDCELPDWQRKGYNQMAHRMFLELEEDASGQKDFIFLKNALAKNHKLRLWLICPKAIDPNAGVGQGIEDIADDAQEGGVKNYAIYTPFRAPLPHLVEYLSGRGARVWVLQGGISPDEQDRRLDAWRRSLGSATPDKPSTILSTIKFAESWEIPETRYEYFLGEEYVREDNAQAEDRAVRLISEGTTLIQYVKFLNTMQADILESLYNKTRNVRAMYDGWDALKVRYKAPD